MWTVLLGLGFYNTVDLSYCVALMAGCCFCDSQYLVLLVSSSHSRVQLRSKWYVGILSTMTAFLLPETLCSSCSSQQHKFCLFFFCDDYTPNINHLFYRRFPSTPNAKAPRCLVSRSGDFLGLCPHSADICGDFIFHTSVSDKEQVVLWDFSFEFNSGLWTHLLLVFPSRPLFQIVWLSW